MKQLYITLLFLFVLVACSNDDETGEPNPPVTPEEQNKYVTGIDLSKSYFLEKPLPAFEQEAFHALGYGYDITGKYAHPDWIRKKVLNPQKFEDDHYDDVVRNWRVFNHGGLGTITGTKEEAKKLLLEKIQINTTDVSSEYKNAFKGVFDTPFENDTTFMGLQYYFAIDAFVSCWYEYYFVLFRDNDLLLLRDYLTDEFKADLESKPADEIIKLYGTHVMVDVEVGWRQDYYYRSSSDEDLQKRMVNASSNFLNSSSVIWTSPGTDAYYQKENLYAEYVSGVDPVNEPVAWMFDITNYSEKQKFEVREHAIEAESTVLVNWGKRSKFGSIIPIYEFISDVSKREALQQAYQTYLSK